MAGIGVDLKKIYEKHTLTTNLLGIGYSAVVTVAPMFVVIVNILLMIVALVLMKKNKLPIPLIDRRKTNEIKD